MVATLPVITIKDGEDGFDARVGDEDWKKIHKQVVEYTTQNNSAWKDHPYVIVIISKKG